MIPSLFLETIIDPGLAFLQALGGPTPTTAVRANLLAIALQESGPKLDARYQDSPSSSAGPARGWWQFEQGGGVNGVLTHPASQPLARKLCEACHVVFAQSSVWRAIEGHDILATGIARLLIYTDPYAVPTSQQAAWTMYCDRLWRPGKPHPENWPTNWITATEAVAAAP